MSDLEDCQGSNDELDTKFVTALPPQPSTSTYSEEQTVNEYNATNTSVQSDDISTSASYNNLQQGPSFKRREQTKENSEQLAQTRRQPGHNDEQLDNSVDPQPAILALFDKALEQECKKQKKRSVGEILKDSKDEELASLRERMKQAAEMDVVANEQQKPAVAKLKMLDEVMVYLNNSNLFDSILDNQLLEAIRMWLEPLPDHSLPNLQIQNEMLDTLDKLPAAVEHLRESGIGKIAYFYKIARSVERKIQRKADNLVAKWTRLVLHRSESYRNRSYQVQDYDKGDILQQRKPFSPEDIAKNIDETRVCVSIPPPVSPDYDIAPRSTVRKARSTSTSKDHAFNRLKRRMRSLERNSQQKKQKDQDE